MTSQSSTAYSEPFMANAAIEPPAKVGVRSSDRSNIGCATRRSVAMNPASVTAAMTRQMMTPGSDQLFSPARIRP